MAVLFTLNDVVKQSGAVLTEDELQELEDKREDLMTKLATAGSDIGMIVMTGSVCRTMVESNQRQTWSRA